MTVAVEYTSEKAQKSVPVHGKVHAKVSKLFPSSTVTYYFAL